MPTYEYQCLPNGHRCEIRHGINEEPVTECPECGGPVRRVIHPVGIVFKGSGFYATDSRKASSTATSPPENKDKPATEGKTGTSEKSESKPEPSPSA